jgi:hypothetical protein
MIELVKFIPHPSGEPVRAKLRRMWTAVRNWFTPSKDEGDVEPDIW